MGGCEPRSGETGTVAAQSFALELRWGELAEGLVAALAVEEDLDVVEDLGAELGFRWPRAAVEELLLEAGEAPVMKGRRA